MPQAFNFFQPINPPRSVQAMVHRGLKAAAPENTIPAFELCIKNGFEWIEVDVRLTRDRQHVIIHNGNVDYTKNGTGLVSELTLEQIRSLDAGAWFAPRFTGTKFLTLRETLNFCKGKINLYLDCKAIDPILLVKEIKEAGMENQVIVYDDPDTLGIVETESHGTIPIMTNYRTNPNISAWVGDDHPIALEIKYESVTPELIRELKNAGVITQVQCLGQPDVPETWQRLMEMGVDWIQTDFGEGVIADYTWRLTDRNRPVWVAAHRGALAFAPENTISAFQKAISLGVDFIELDIRTTRDGKMVILHDRSLKRTAQVDKYVYDVDFAEIRELSAGRWFGIPYQDEKIPTPDEVFEIFRGKIRFYIDLKAGESAALVKTMRHHGVVDDCIVFGVPEDLAAVKSLEPQAKVMPRLNDPNRIESLIAICQPYAFDARWDILSGELIAHCHNRGIKIFSDAMGEHEIIGDFHQAMEWRIDCIQTNEPLVLLRAIELYMQKNY